MKLFLLIGAILILNGTFCHAGLQVDLIDAAGLASFKANNLTSPGVAKASLNDVEQTASKSVSNPATYSVTNTTQVPPNGNKHEYYSWAPYYWPDCTGIPNVTDQMHQCPYKVRDGQFVPDLNLISDPNDSGSLINDLTTLSITYVFKGDESYAEKAVKLLQVWFLNSDTYMLPDLNYGQVVRGPGNWTGRVEGVLDLRFFVYVPQVANLLQNSSSWNSNLTDGLKTWFTQYSTWLQTSTIGQGARDAANNHGTFYAVQLATYLHYLGRDNDAIQVIQRFIGNQFQHQITKSGDQPLESARTRPFHYQCFNLVALTYLARLSSKINGPNLWTATTADGGTIKSAIDLLAGRPLPTNESSTDFLVPLYAARQYYGDSDGKYGNVLSKILTKSSASDEYWELWNPTALDNVPTTPSGSNSASSIRGLDNNFVLVGLIVLVLSILV